MLLEGRLNGYTTKYFWFVYAELLIEKRVNDVFNSDSKAIASFIKNGFLLDHENKKTPILARYLSVFNFGCLGVIYLFLIETTSERCLFVFF